MANGLQVLLLHFDKSYIFANSSDAFILAPFSLLGASHVLQTTTPSLEIISGVIVHIMPTYVIVLPELQWSIDIFNITIENL